MMRSSPGCNMKEFIDKPWSEALRTIEGSDFLRHCASVLWSDGNLMLVPGDVQVRDMVGDGEGGEFGGHAGDRFYFGDNQIETALPFGVEGLVVFVQIALEGFDHADDFFLAHFLTAAESVFVGAVVKQGVGDEIFFPMSKPAHCGPRMALPPLKQIRS